MQQPLIPSINFHLWEPCNMRCRFCFATFADTKKNVLPKGHLPKKEAEQVVKLLAGAGFKKITFAGGEPMLCPWLLDLIVLAKSLGMTTMLVTNGSCLKKQWLSEAKGHLDWLTLSIDSLRPDVNIWSGRAVVGKRVLTEMEYTNLAEMTRLHEIRLKINTVVHAGNWNEDFSLFINKVQPERWKLFQVLPIKGENDAHFSDFEIAEEQFLFFVKHHQTMLLGHWYMESRC